MQAPTSKRQGLCKNSIALSKFHRRGEHCSPAKALRYHRAPRVEQSPTPTINRKKIRLNFIAISQFRRRGEHCSPAFAAPAGPKIFPRTVAGLQCRPLQAKGKIIVKILSLFQNFIVGAGLGSARLCRTRRPQKITPAPRGTPLPAPPKRPFCCKNENSLKNLPHAVNKLTLVSVTFHPRAFIINLSKHCLPLVQNGAAAWF